MAAALSRVYAGLCRRDRLTSKECPFWLYLFCGQGPARDASEAEGKNFLVRSDLHKR